MSLLAMSLLVPAAEVLEKPSGADVTATPITKDSAEVVPADWKEWAQWAEKLHPVTDQQGHGPDIGTDEWSRALDRQLKVSDAAGQGPDLGSQEWRQAVEKKLRPRAVQVPAKDRQLLSAHETVARFVGLTDHQCLGRTALCPDRCGESGKLATFAIVKYLRYEKPGQFGDPKQAQFLVLVEDNMKNPKVPAAIRDAILALKPGALVHLQWNHDYITQDGSKFPERPLCKLAPLTKEQAAQASPEAPAKAPGGE